MKKMKPFGGKARRFSEGGAADEPDETGTYTSGVRMGRNANIGDDTRARAMAMLDRNEAKSTLKSLADERPAPKAAPKSAAAKPAAAKPAAAVKPAASTSSTDMERRGAGAETKGGNDEPMSRAEARMADEGGPNFRKGGAVRGCGMARRGLTKGTMR